MTCSTIFFSIFYALQFLSLSGFGITSFMVSRSQAKFTIFLIGFSYICDSAYFVTMDSRFVNSALKYCILFLQVCFLYGSTRKSAKCLKILDANIRFILANQVSESDQDGAQNLESITQ